ncbi:hypothetical protein J0X14_17865 [Muricauda sp. CAU 1633]|uniref:hypothetical protein n=1 Tax=Allomuricauda sp. CAU 1633 TaxID=2816036 RepID=UPI001A8C0845|nr:hypothetical protein [Muricauda sp. CAU 1633]MBO0324181.1 hypothetical protein [Muricauda sp. CAU 1633]
MTTKELFDPKHIDIFIPDNIEFISFILTSLGYGNTNESSEEAREHGLDTIEKLLELELIEVFSWGHYEDKLKGKEIPLIKKMRYMAELWPKGAKRGDFYEMPMFKYKDWYLEALERDAKDFDTYEDFFKKIGNLEQWIEQNRPKE